MEKLVSNIKTLSSLHSSIFYYAILIRTYGFFPEDSKLNELSKQNRQRCTRQESRGAKCKRKRGIKLNELSSRIRQTLNANHV